MNRLLCICVYALLCGCFVFETGGFFNIEFKDFSKKKKNETKLNETKKKLSMSRRLSNIKVQLMIINSKEYVTGRIVNP